MSTINLKTVSSLLFTLLISISHSHGQLNDTTTTMVNNATNPDSPSQLTSNPNVNRNRSREASITNYLKNALDENYDKRLRPDFFGPATKVGVTILVISLSSVKEVEMEFQADMFFRQTWQDPRLAHDLPDIDEMSLASVIMDDIWVPDTSFRNGKSAYLHEATVPNRLIRIYPNGTVMTSIRLTLTAACAMTLKLYPFDFQVCAFEIQSYGYTTNKLRYHWKGGEKGVEIALDSVTLPQYEVKGYRQYSRTEPTLTGSYDTLGIQFLLVRSLNHYIAQIYVPSFLIVVISYFALWMERENSEPRLALAVTSVLTMTAIYLALATTGPPVNYIKAVDVYLGVCFLGVFITLLESVVLCYFVKRMKHRRMEVQNDSMHHLDGHNSHREKNYVQNNKIELAKLTISVAKIDIVCRIVFPIVFILFHFVYFGYYLNASQLNFEEGYWTPMF